MPGQVTVFADVFALNAPVRMVQNEYMFSSYDKPLTYGMSVEHKGTGETVSGLEGSPDDLRWLRYYQSPTPGINIGDQIVIPMGPYIKGGCRLQHVVWMAEVDTGSLDFLCTLKSSPGVGTSDAWSDLDNGSATLTGSGRKQIDFQLGPNAVVHGAAHSPGYTFYKLVLEVTGKSGSPLSIGQYAMAFLWSENDLACLVGSASL